MKRWKKSHQHCRDGHRHDGEQHRTLPPRQVSNPPENDSSHGTNQKARGKCPEGGDQRDDWVFRGEKQLPDRYREETVNREVIPLHHVSDEADENESAE